MSHTHKHDHDHSHDHNHFSPFLLVLYFIGVFLYISTFFIDHNIIFMLLNLAALVLAGFHVIYEGLYLTVSESVSHKSFRPNVHLLMTLAAIGAIIIGEYGEATLLILIFAGAHYLEEYAQNRSKKEITKLLKLNPTSARLITSSGQVNIVDIKTLKVGDILQVLNGDQIATDGIVVSGYASVDESSITGEPIPKDKVVGDILFGSTINVNGTFMMEVTKTSDETVFAKIVQMVSQSQSNISKTAVFIKRLEPKYVTAVLLLSPIIFMIFYFLFRFDLSLSFNRTMVFLIVTSPCALAVTDIPASLSAISNLAKQGILFKGGSYLSNFADIKAIAFDKTGTITEGKPVVTNLDFAPSLDKMTIDEYKKIIYNMERYSNHPLSNAITSHINIEQLLDLEVENKIGVGIFTTYNNDNYIIGKPSYFKFDNQVILTKLNQYQAEGKTVMLFSRNDQVMAIIAVSDLPKPSSYEAIKFFNNHQIHTALITGDSAKTAQYIGDKIKINQIIGDILPDQKAQIISDLKDQYQVVAMVGDGINDAPALVAADVGIAMGNGTDIAIDVADAVLVKNDVSKIIYIYKIAKKLRRIVWQNIVFAMAVVIFLVVMNFIGLLNMTIAVTIHEGSTLIVILSGLRMLLPIKKGDKHGANYGK